MAVYMKLEQMFPIGFYYWIAVSQHVENINWQAGIKNFFLCISTRIRDQI